MNWNLEEAIAYYGKQGAPGDQNSLVLLLKEVQKEHGGIPAGTVAQIARAYDIRESFLLAVIRRFPSLRLQNTHSLELCGGPNCSRRGTLLAFVEEHYGKNPAGFTWKTVPCMRECGKGPNFRWDGRLYSHGTPEMLKALIEETCR